MLNTLFNVFHPNLIKVKLLKDHQQNQNIFNTFHGEIENVFTAAKQT